MSAPLPLPSPRTPSFGAPVRPVAPPTPDARPSLEVVPGRSRRPRIVYALGAIALMISIALLQLLLSIAIGDTAYQISDLQGRARDLDRTAAAIQDDVEVLSSPQNLGGQAHALGLVPADSSAFVNVKRGRVTGSSSPAAASSDTMPPSKSVPNALLDAPGRGNGAHGSGTHDGAQHRVSDRTDGNGNGNHNGKGNGSKADRNGGSGGTGNGGNGGNGNGGNGNGGGNGSRADDGLIGAPTTH